MMGNVVEWSIANGYVIDRTFEFPQPVLDIALVEFNDDDGSSVCILARPDRMTVVTPSGSTIDVPLPFQATSIFAMQKGLLLERSKHPPSSANMPVLFSLMHPLDEIKPVVVQGDPSQPLDHCAFVSDPVETLVFVHAAAPSFLAFFHPDHRTFRVKSIAHVVSPRDAKSTSIVPEIALRQVFPCIATSTPHKLACKLFVTSNVDLSPILCIFNPSSGELVMQPMSIIVPTPISTSPLPPPVTFPSPTILRCRLACPVLRKCTTTCQQRSLRSFDLVVVTLDHAWELYRHLHKICSLALPVGQPPVLPHQVVAIKDTPCVHTIEVHVAGTPGTSLRLVLPLDFTSALLERAFECLDAVVPSLVLLWRVRIRTTTPTNDWQAFTSQLLVAALPPVEKVGEPSTTAPSTTSVFATAYDRLVATESFQKLAHAQPKIFGRPSPPSPSTIDDYRMDCVDLAAQIRVHLPTVFTTLHLLYEDLKLSTSSFPWLRPLGLVLHAVAHATALPAYMQHYVADLGPIPVMSTNRDSKGDKNPSNLFKSLQNVSAPADVYGWVQRRMAMFHYHRLHNSRVSRFGKAALFPTSHLFPTTQHVVALYSKLYPDVDSSSSLHPVRAQDVVHYLVTIPAFEHLMDDLPDGVALPLRYARTICKHAPGNSWDAATCRVIQRPDWVGQGGRQEDGDAASKNRPAPPDDDDGFDDVMHLHAPLYPTDLRLKEVGRLLRSNKIMYLKIPLDPSLSDSDVINMQQARLLMLCKRSMALPVARGMVTLGSLTPATATTTSWIAPLPIPPMPLAARIAESNAKIHLDSSTYKELTLWPQFHNGVATALRLPPAHDTNVTAQWIFSHKPKPPTTDDDHDPMAAHAGFVLGLGLRGHLSQLSQSAIFQYLSMDHELTSVGLLLGLAATSVTRPKDLTLERSATRVLSLHIPSLLPPTYSHVNITPSVQTAALIGLGLVYQGTGNRNMTEIMLSEVVSAPVVMSPTSSQPSVDLSQKESYALAAGVAVGLIALGRRNDPGLADLQLEAKLVKYMVGGSHKVRPIPGNCVLRTKTKSPSREYVNVDVTAAGSALALAFMYMHSNNERVRQQLAIPATVVSLEAIRPDLLFVRVVASNVVAWDAIRPSVEWIHGHQPPCFTRDGPVDPPTAQEGYANILAGACFSVGLKFADIVFDECEWEGVGSHDVVAKSTLLACISDFCEWRSKAKAVSRVTWERCLGVLTQSLALVMAGSGDLDTFRALRVVLLRQKADAMADVTYGNHMAVTSALGLLFLGGGRCAFQSTPFAIAVLVVAFFPMYPSKTSDQKYHLQALRHLYVLAIDSNRFVETIDADTGAQSPVDLVISTTGLKNHKVVRTPHLLPAYDKLSVLSSRHFPVNVNVKTVGNEDDGGNANACRVQTLNERRRIYVKRKQGDLDSPQLALLRQFRRWFVHDTSSHTNHAFCKRVWQECEVQQKPHVLAVYLNAKHTEVAVLSDALAHSLNVSTLHLMHLHMEVEGHMFPYELPIEAGAFDHEKDQHDDLGVAQLVNEDFVLGYTNALLRYFSELHPNENVDTLAQCAHLRFLGDHMLAQLE
ncbi:hypothetical protein DYB34_005026 [Aphanomyces astaci]|uniref:Uncharacterized protein n=1 Tax=Aphanomyces astaci TaxID=112090 RepID=A0A418BGQ3_APHAT|nr:hypothetical protein DYB34_005026 [Aphanomyces astaci]